MCDNCRATTGAVGFIFFRSVSHALEGVTEWPRPARARGAKQVAPGPPSSAGSPMSRYT